MLSCPHGVSGRSSSFLQSHSYKCQKAFPKNAVAEQVQTPLDDGTLISKSVDHTINENEVDHFANLVSK